MRKIRFLNGYPPKLNSKHLFEEITLNSIKKYWHKGKVLNVGAGRDCKKLGDIVISGDLREGVDEYTKMAQWKDPIEPDCKFDANDKFPFESGRFDCVMSMHLLEHMENVIYTLGEMLRVTKYGGVVCGVVPCVSACCSHRSRELEALRILEL